MKNDSASPDMNKIASSTMYGNFY